MARATARGEAGAASDVGLLIVLEQHVPLTRSLYRRWDETPVTYGAEDLTPSAFYSKEDAEAAFEGAGLVVAAGKPAVAREGD